MFVGPRAWRAIVTRVNMIDLTRRSPTYEARLEKYAKRGFAVFAGSTSFKKSTVSAARVWLSRAYNPDVDGICRLLYAEHVQRVAKDAQGKIKTEIEEVPDHNRRFRSFLSIAVDYGYDPGYVKSMSAKLSRLNKRFDFSRLLAGDVAALFDSGKKDDLPGSAHADMRKFKLGRKDTISFLKFKNKEQVLERLSEDSFQWVTENPGKQQGQQGEALLTGSFHPMSFAEASFLKEQAWSEAGQKVVAEGEESIPLLLFGGTGRYHCNNRYEHVPGQGGGWQDLCKAGFSHSFELRCPSTLDRNTLSAADIAHLLAPSFQAILTRVHPQLQLSTAASDLLCELLHGFIDKLKVAMCAFFFRPVFGQGVGVDVRQKFLGVGDLKGAARLMMSWDVAENPSKVLVQKLYAPAPAVDQEEEKKEGDALAQAPALQDGEEE